MSGINLKHDGWVVVADGEKALFLRNEGDAEHPNLQVFREMEQDNPPTREQGTDRPGRVHESAGPGRSSVETTDWQQLGKERFAKEIAERLYKYAHADRFDKLILVAPPKVLGEMREAMHQEVLDRIISEIPKTLTNHSIDKIENLLLH
ncbi:host attachment protein [Georhizobium profundi]|jgi:protein required for attachment to host cells|uniref:Host attachment protein n=1 Tax=Georhizobium profundi TaxID=2341112 RepID=A0A3S9B3V3_9HYPH|nr:host attachment family protein [Georhizobium profundi]AZN71613.1 host attachment protein [Georhizobium profundi]